MNPESNALLARWADWLLGQGNGNTPPGHDLALESTWPWPAWLTVLVVLACVALVAWVYRRERGTRGWPVHVGLALLRLSLVGLVLFMLCGWRLRPFRTDLPDVAIALDVSQSMSLVDAYDPAVLSQLRSRLAAVGLKEVDRLSLAKLLLLENQGSLVRELEQRYHVRYYLVGNHTRLAAGEALPTVAAEDASSRLGQAVREVLEAQRGRPTAALILFTDGITTEGKSLREAAAQARSRHVPLFTVGLGSDRAPRNVRLGDLVAEEAAFVGDLVNFDFRITASGYDGETLRVRLRTASGEVLAEKTVKVSGPQPVAESLSHRPRREGPVDYVVEAVPLPGETDSADNQLTRRVLVANPTLKVLLVQEYPSYEFRYLKTLLARERKLGEAQDQKAFELTTILQEADPNWNEATARNVFPVSRDELFRYHVVLFGDVNPSFLGASGAGGGAVLKNLADFVRERGGGLAFLAGPRHTPLALRNTPLAELLPFDVNSVALPDARAAQTAPIVLRPTPLGLSSPNLLLRDSAGDSLQSWRQLPGVYWLLEINELKSGVRVLAEHPQRTGSSGQHLPAITLHYAGAGKVLFHATDETWRWRFRVGDAFFARYWTQTIRLLGRSTVFEAEGGARLIADRKRYRLGEPVRLRTQFQDDRKAPPQDDGVVVVVEQAEGKTHRVTLRRETAQRGVFEGTLGNLGEGNFHAYIASPTLPGPAAAVDFQVEAPLGERAAREMDAAELRQAATDSGGQFFTLATAAGLPQALPPGRAVPIESLPPVAIWNSWKIALLFLALITAEWILRKWAGLV